MVGFCFFISISSYCQDSIAYKELYLAKSLFEEKAFDEAKIRYKAALILFEEDQIWDQWELCYKGLQKIARKTKDANSSIDSLPKYYSVIPKTELKITARCKLYRAANLDDMGSIYLALNEFKESLDIYNEFSDSIDLKESERFVYYLYRRIGTSYSRLGDQVTAIKYARKGYEVASKFKNEKAICDFLILIGKYSYHNEEPKKAIQQYKKAQVECGSNIPILHYLAETYIYLDSLDQAKRTLDQAEKLINSKESFWALRKQHKFSAQYYFKKSQFNDSFIAKEKELAILKNQYDIRDYSKELVVYAQDLYSTGYLQKSMTTVQEAISNYYALNDSLDIWSTPKLDKSLPDIYILEAFYLKAKYFSNLYDVEKNTEALEKATFYYQQLFSYFDQLKNTYSSTSSQYRMGQHTQEIYSDAIHFYSKLYESKKVQTNFEVAIDLAQRANAFALKNSISERKRLELAKVPSVKINEYLHLKSLAYKNDSDSIHNIENLLVFNELKTSLFNQFHSLDRYKENQILSLTEIQNQLENNSLLIKYFYSSNKLIWFAISDENFKLGEINLPSEFDSLIIQSQNLTSDPSLWNVKKYTKVSKAIYDIILSDVLKSEDFKNKKHLIIAPDGPLKNISFSSLITQEVEDIIDVKDYLVHDYEISYLYYCAQLKTSTKSPRSKKGFISFGIEYQDKFLEDLIEDYLIQNTDQVTRNFSLAKLKNAKKEAINSAKILNGKSFTNSEVTLNSVLANINNFNLIHFSTHAFVDNQDYLKSFIALNRGQNETYQFKYEDILNLNLDAELVVLSACQTNSGTNIIGEGLMSLSRAFIQSGCKSSMGAYWNAPDLSTMKLMELFYSNIKLGMSKSNALRNAQIEFLENEELSTPRTRSPFFWSSWAIYGDNTSIPEIKNSFFTFSNKGLLFSLGVLSLVLILVFRKRLKSTSN